MKNRFLHVPLASVTVVLIVLTVSAPWVASAATNIKKVSTFVGGDIHTLTYTKSGLFVTGHESGSISTNEGFKWNAIPSFRNADIMGWATTNSGYLAGGHNGMFRSSNGGKSFARFNFYGKVSDVHSLGAAGKIVYLGSPQVGFLRSLDSGKTWKLINGKFGQGLMGSMLVDPANPLRIIAPDMSNGLVTTFDGGKSWVRFGGPTSVISVDWNPKDHAEILALSMGEGAITRNNGKTWSTFSVPMGSSAIAVSATGTKIFAAVLVGTKAEIFSSSNLGKSWF